MPTTHDQPRVPAHLTGIEDAVPGLAEHRAVTTLLNPRRGNPNEGQSSIGGPLRWPGDEPWPVCEDSHEDWLGVWDEADTHPLTHFGDVWTVRLAFANWNDVSEAILDKLRRYVTVAEVREAGPVPLIPVAQLRRQDVPDLPWPDDADLFQLLWCPMEHGSGGPAPVVRWRKAAEISGWGRADNPFAVADRRYVPWPCVLEPVRTVEYLPDAPGIAAALGSWSPLAPAWKAGGLRWWRTSEPECCDAPMLLTLTIGPGTPEAWFGAVPEEPDPAGVELGPGNNFALWRCAGDPAHVRLERALRHALPTIDASVTVPERLARAEEEIPGLAAHRGVATMLRPRPGEPGVRENSIGGPLLWPAHEPWPTCSEDHEAWLEFEANSPYPDGLPLDEMRGPIPLLPIAQLFRGDVPGFTGPDEADVMQVLWCPISHHMALWCPKVSVRWRRAAEITQVLEHPPTPPGMAGPYLPRPSLLSPERVVEYDAWGVPEGIRQEEIDWYEDGEKLGGFAGWSLSDPHPVHCACGSDVQLLMCIHGYDIDVTIGRGYSLWIWSCTTSWDHPVQTSMQ
ncbi:hypothetical protein Afil01_30380 [Actinorhabdospora filicis]|uniref:DUF1963 domain-containing protein n=1 Tax=Actinorhabdospora filicis TaxID=1785913 RepID=A0A9W6WA48_9ACTN|nr:hypothetical protein [Actinorhabdospora filicis]GLZ78231.1 hypothetical protein Afil01_30380 [Actinorhabdospora filicis]